MANKATFVSVVIPAYNEATYIDRLLEALSKQNFKSFEVIVSDAHSKDGTKEVIGAFKNRLDIKLVESPPKGPAHGRNAGAAKARGDWLLFLDADVDIDDSDFIDKMVGTAESKSWSTATGRMKTRTGHSYDFLYYYQRMLAHTRRPVASGYCILTKRKLFQVAGGFNENILFGEDYEYVSRTASNGFGFVNTADVYIDPRRNQEEGLGLAWRGTQNEFYRLFFGYKKLEKQPVKYQFGKHQKRQK
ncbi:MAG TPA: glycosyltransferase [Candidatus Saccharimonadales bacterium]|nr:glycosyltransferase [Candidatus Saccharimonadales bacterium]